MAGEGGRNLFCFGRFKLEWTAVAEAQADAKAIAAIPCNPFEEVNIPPAPLLLMLGG